MCVQNQKAALKTHGVTAFTADQLAERDAEIRGAGYEEGVQDGIEATIAAQEEDMGKACVAKVVMGYGGGASIAAQQRLARFKHTFTFQDMRQTRIRLGKENEINRSLSLVFSKWPLRDVFVSSSSCLVLLRDVFVSSNSC